MSIERIEYLGAVCIVLELDRSLSETYWLNVNDLSFPFVGVIEHTNMEPASAYGGRHIVYLSRYAPADDPLVVLALHLVLGDDRHEGLGEGPLREQAAQEVRNLEGHQEGVHQQARAEHPRIDHVAEQPGDPGNESQAADDGRTAEEAAAHPGASRPTGCKLVSCGPNMRGEV